MRLYWLVIATFFLESYIGIVLCKWRTERRHHRHGHLHYHHRRPKHSGHNKYSTLQRICSPWHVPRGYNCMEMGCPLWTPCNTPGAENDICCPHSVEGFITSCCLTPPKFELTLIEKDVFDFTCPPILFPRGYHCMQIDCEIGQRCENRFLRHRRCCKHVFNGYELTCCLAVPYRNTEPTGLTHYKSSVCPRRQKIPAHGHCFDRGCKAYGACKSARATGLTCCPYYFHRRKITCCLNKSRPLTESEWLWPDNAYEHALLPKDHSPSKFNLVPYSSKDSRSKAVKKSKSKETPPTTSLLTTSTPEGVTPALQENAALGDQSVPDESISAASHMELLATTSAGLAGNKPPGEPPPQPKVPPRANNLPKPPPAPTAPPKLPPKPSRPPPAPAAPPKLPPKPSRPPPAPAAPPKLPPKPSRPPPPPERQAKLDKLAPKPAPLDKQSPKPSPLGPLPSRPSSLKASRPGPPPKIPARPPPIVPLAPLPRRGR